MRCQPGCQRCPRPPESVRRESEGRAGRCWSGHPHVSDYGLVFDSSRALRGKALHRERSEGMVGATTPHVEDILLFAVGMELLQLVRTCPAGGSRPRITWTELLLDLLDGYHAAVQSCVVPGPRTGWPDGDRVDKDVPVGNGGGCVRDKDDSHLARLEELSPVGVTQGNRDCLPS